MGTALARVQDDGTIEWLPSRRGPIERIRHWMGGGAKPANGGDVLEKAIARRVEAALQGAKVSEGLGFLGYYDSGPGVVEPTGTTFDRLRRFAESCGVTTAIINRRVDQVSAFSDTPEYRFGHPRTPGFRVCMTIPEQEASEADTARMRELEQFVRETGFCSPPEEECPRSYQPGFDGFLKQFVRDSLTLDQVAVRTWASKTAPERYPVVSFACIDGGLVRRSREEPAGLKNGVAQVKPYPTQRTNAGGVPIRYVKLATSGGVIEDEFTSDELSVAVRNMRTDQQSRGYGYSEVEQAIDDITVWLYCREYNASRFRKDSLPRGLLMLLGKVDNRQLEHFKLQWRQMMQGVSNRWAIPMLTAEPQQGSSVVWTPFDLSSRDMEYHQFTFAVALVMHAKFRIHPEETGFESLSPFRPPLSQASPESKLKYSQDSGLTPLLRFVASFINRRLIWRLYPDRRYSFEFVGLGEWDASADVSVWNQMLQGGLTTPRYVWRVLDQPIPEALKEHPAWDLPLPWAQGVQMLQQMEQYEQQQTMQQRQMAMEEDDSRGQRDLQNLQAMLAQGHQGQDGVPDDGREDQGGDGNDNEAMDKAVTGPGWFWT
jgi:hypothetical protein